MKIDISQTHARTRTHMDTHAYAHTRTQSQYHIASDLCVAIYTNTN